tara:strand:- start:812 stop:2428 length:1617 start_codon:yes stop_codon:yes gene_type:complete
MCSKNLYFSNDVVHREENLILDDGVRLKSNIWMPNKIGEWPALLMRQPYGKDIASTVTYPHPSWFASHGFLVIIQDVRGQGESTGQFSGFAQEASDTSQSHAWARNLPECNGLLGTYGFSYQGITQLLAIPNTAPPECLAPAMTGLNEGAHWSCEGGAFWWHIGISWGLQLAALKARREGKLNEWIEIRKSLENGSYLRDGTELLKKYDPNGMAHTWLETSNRFSNNWTVHKPLETWLEQPMLLIGGWWDPHLIGVLDIYEKSLKAGGNPSIYIGPASHLEWWEGTHKILLKFFQKHLQDQQKLNSTQNENRLWNITRKKWENSKTTQSEISYWGLKSTGIANIDSTDGILEPNLNGSGSIVLVHDPWRPTPAIGGHLAPKPGTANRSEIDKRFDVATFTTLPMTKTLRLEGRPLLEIEASADQPGFDLCIALSIVEETQQEIIQLSTGFLRIVGEKSLEVSSRKIKLQPILADFTKGSCLRISISGSAWPAIAINPGDSRNQCQGPSPNCQVTTISLNISKSKLYFSPLITHEGFQD